MALRVGICGVGAFARCFIPLFKAHPAVEQVILCDLDAEKLAARSAEFDIPDTCPSLDDLCDTDVDAIAIITQHWLHAPQAVQALEAGKHVYSAVPAAHSMEELEALVTMVEQTGLVYMIGETSYYYPCAIYCRKRFEAGDFGRIVYAEGEYLHDWDHGLYDVAKWRGGERWLETAGGPPMYYPTHSTSLIISVTGAYMTHVSCQGIPDVEDPHIYDPDVNIWGNVFSNESALFRMSDGSACRINEFRRVGHPGTVGMSMYGTLGSYEEQVDGQVWVTKDRSATVDLRELLACSGVPASEVTGEMSKVTSADGTHSGASRVHDLARLPAEFIGLPNGHNGSHQFLVDDFIRACVTRSAPPNNIWQAARYMVPGLVAHESAKREGQLLEIPDFGDVPADWPRLEY